MHESNHNAVHRARVQLSGGRMLLSWRDAIWADRIACKWNGEVHWPEPVKFSENEHVKHAVIRLSGLEIVLEFRSRSGEAVVEERVVVRNIGTVALDFRDFHVGWAMPLLDENLGLWQDAGDREKFTAIPFRRDMREPHGTYEEYTLRDLVTRRGGYRTDWRGGVPRIPTVEFGAEGWVWDRGPQGALLFLKHARKGIEFALIEPFTYLQDVPNPTPRHLRIGLLFGGAGFWHGDPEEARRLPPGETYEFGTTIYRFFDGDWRDGYRLFRQEMRRRGHGLPEAYDPPVHWNELYDNPLWWIRGDTPENRAKYYRLEHMEEEAAKAAELGCEALYLDPGWDTIMGSAIWAKDRLGRIEDFVLLMREKYGLRVALHNTFASWTNPASFPENARVLTAEGKRLNVLCGASEQFWKIKAERLSRLAQAGVVFFMIDGTWFTGACYDPSHGHSIPARRAEHCACLARLVEVVRKAHPNVLIEVHDPVLSGDLRYTPCHYLQGGLGHQEIWACEYMWEPLDDLLTGRAVSLYYFNLAYEIPLYIHIDLRKDNANALAFWWYASTCRHLGVGGKCPSAEVWRIHQKSLREGFRPHLKPTFTHTDRDDPLPGPELWAAHKAAMHRYRELKPFFVRGAFFGLDETVHVHTLAEQGAVVCLFNLSEKPAEQRLRFTVDEIGLSAGTQLHATDDDAHFEQIRGECRLSILLPPLAPAVVVLRRQ